MKIGLQLKSTLMSLALLCGAGVGLAHSQEVLSAQPPLASATDAGRLIIKRGEDYVPSTTDAATLFDQLEASMKDRRAFAWHIVEQMLRPVRLTLLDNTTTVDVPLWQTWYEGRPSGASANQEIAALINLYFSKLKPVLEANPNADIEPVVAETIAAFSEKDLSSSLTNENLTSVLHQFDNSAVSGALLGQGTTVFSPSFVEHMLREARGIDTCPLDVALADTDPPSADQFSHCIKEFPRSAVMIKTSWERMAPTMPAHDTSASGMNAAIGEGTWPGPGHAENQPATAPVDRSKIYTNITGQGDEFALTGIHFVTKDVREWVWVSLWWDPDASKDFGADRPRSLDSFNGGVWKNYKMCVNSSFAEGDATPWSHYTGSQESLGASIKAVHDGIQKQIDEGATERPQDFDVFWGLADLPQPLHLNGALGPWAAPNSGQTSWCSNPNIEQHPGNARTSCIGCHQVAHTTNERRGGEAIFLSALTGDIPQFARVRARKNFPAEFSWSFGIEFRPAIGDAKRAAEFEWPGK